MAKRISPPVLKRPLIVQGMPANTTMKGMRVRAVVGAKRLVLMADPEGNVYCATRTIDLADTHYVTTDMLRAWAALAGEKYTDVRMAVQAERERRKADKDRDQLDDLRSEAGALGYRLVRDTKRRTAAKGAGDAGLRQRTAPPELVAVGKRVLRKAAGS